MVCGGGHAGFSCTPDLGLVMLTVMAMHRMIDLRFTLPASLEPRPLLCSRAKGCFLGWQLQLIFLLLSDLQAILPGL